MSGFPSSCTWCEEGNWQPCAGTMDVQPCLQVGPPESWSVLHRPAGRCGLMNAVMVLLAACRCHQARFNAQLAAPSRRDACTHSEAILSACMSLPPPASRGTRFSPSSLSSLSPHTELALTKRGATWASPTQLTLPNKNHACALMHFPCTQSWLSRSGAPLHLRCSMQARRSRTCSRWPALPLTCECQRCMGVHCD